MLYICISSEKNNKGGTHNITHPKQQVSQQFKIFSLLSFIIKSPTTMSIESILPIKEIIRWTWNNTTKHAGYICYRENLQKLRNAMEDLKDMRSDLMREVETAERQNMERKAQVNTWLSRVGDMGDEVDELIRSASEEVENNCLGSCCPKNCWSRYKMGKEIDGKLKDIHDTKTKRSEFAEVAIRVEETIDKVWRELQDEKAVIAIYGKGGVGKTTILAQICNKLLSSQCSFDFVIWAVASQDLNFGKLQGDIAKEIGFPEDRLKDKSPDEKANEVRTVLSQKKFILLLDDIWERVPLAEMGVPVPNRENGCKVLFTTRSEDVCTQMGAEEKIKVGCLPWVKAWELFQEMVGEDTLNSHLALPMLAETIAKMCNGLPLALITIGLAMAGKKTPGEWDDSIKVLREATSEFSGTEFQDLALLKFSYDSLPSEKVKSCFLYCALFPEDFSINKCNLIDYWIGEGFLGENNDASRARSEGYNIIGFLVHAYLLEDGGEDVKMHDLIRDLALWVASECGKVKNKYLVEAGAQLAEAPEVAKWEAVRRMSLMSNQIQELIEAPRCDNLLTLCIANNNLKVIASGFFQLMHSLTVLDLSENRELTELPAGFSKKLVSLQYLNLSRTGVRQLPIELKCLEKLKCLNLEYTYQLQTIPLQVISNLSKLIILRMVHCASSDRVVGDGIQMGGHESLARDLQSLEHLNVLTITIRSEYSLQIFASFSKFQTRTQALCLHQFKHSRSLDISFLEGMNSVHELEFSDFMNLQELRIDDSLITRGRCFNSLHRISIVNCSKLEDLTWLTLAPNLEFLAVSRCSFMKEIISEGKLGEAKLSALAKLKVLRLVSLPELKSIYPSALSFPSLKEIVVDRCQKLKKLPLNYNSAREHRIVIKGWEDWWTNLQWEDDATRLKFLHSFKAYMY